MEPVQIAVGAALEAGWLQECDALLAMLFKADRTKALRSLMRLARELDAGSAARLISFLQQQLPDDQAIADVADRAFSEWLVAALQQELASRELEAAAFYRAARAVQPEIANPQNALDRMSSLSLLAMREAFYRRDFSSAVEHGETTTRINPECFEAWQTIGRAQFARGNVAEALEAFRRCSELDGKDAPTWLTYGLVLSQAGDRREALRAFQTARDLGDMDARREADASIAALHPQLVQDATQAAVDGNFELAWQGAAAALSIRPGDAGLDQLRRNLLRQMHGQIRDAWNAGAESTEALCRSYLEKVPADLYASTVLGRTLMRSRAYAEALPVWEAVCRLSPQEAHPLLQVARCCRSLKLKDKGLTAAEAASRLDPALQEATDLAAQFKSWK
jgi:tetratricopeptide (TPR) repeat protein